MTYSKKAYCLVRRYLGGEVLKKLAMIGPQIPGSGMVTSQKECNLSAGAKSKSNNIKQDITLSDESAIEHQ